MDNQTTESKENVFKDLGFSAVQSDKLAIKACLMMQIESFIKNKGLTQARASQLMNVSMPRISDIMRGKIDEFTIDVLVDMLTRTGHHITLNVEHAA